MVKFENPWNDPEMVKFFGNQTFQTNISQKLEEKLEEKLELIMDEIDFKEEAKKKINKIFNKNQNQKFISFIEKQLEDLAKKELTIQRIVIKKGREELKFKKDTLDFMKKHILFNCIRHSISLKTNEKCEYKTYEFDKETYFTTGKAITSNVYVPVGNISQTDYKQSFSVLPGTGPKYTSTANAIKAKLTDYIEKNFSFDFKDIEKEFNQIANKHLEIKEFKKEIIKLLNQALYHIYNKDENWYKKRLELFELLKLKYDEKLFEIKKDIQDLKILFGKDYIEFTKIKKGILDCKKNLLNEKSLWYNEGENLNDNQIFTLLYIIKKNKDKKIKKIKFTKDYNKNRKNKIVCGKINDHIKALKSNNNFLNCLKSKSKIFSEI